MAETAAKACSICGIDVSGKPRAKDAQGRYVCQDCLNKARQTQDVQKNPPQPKAVSQAKPQAEVLGDNSFLLGMGAKNSVAETGTKPCPECGRALTSEAVICVGCGYNFERGKRMQVKVVKAKAEDGAKDQGQKASLGEQPWTVAAIVCVAFGGLIALGVFMPDYSMVIMGVAWGFGVIMGLWALVAAFSDSVVQGVLVLLVPFYILYWMIFKCENAMLRALWVAAVVVQIGAGVAMVMSNMK